MPSSRPTPDNSGEFATGRDDRHIEWIFREYAPRLQRFVNARVGNVTIANDHWRSARVRRELSSPDAGTDLQTHETPETLTIAADHADQVAARIAPLIELLNPDQRRSIWLRYWRELSIDEIAAQLGRSPDAIKQLNHRALRTMSEATRPTTPSATSSLPIDLV